MKPTKPLSMVTKARPSDAIRGQAIAWLLCMRSETVTQAERDAFDIWLAANPSHRRMYETVQAQWEWMEPFKTMPFPARDQALRYRRNKSRRPLFAYSTAAVLLLALALGTFSPYGWLGTPQTYRVGKGQRQTIDLADGSRIELNTGSEVRVHFNHWQRRVDLLQGEAFFTVMHDAGRPFEVRAGNGQIRDIGTAFDVYKKPGQVLVAVQEGVVEVQAAGNRQLTAGQQLSFNGDGQFQMVKGQDVAELTAWRKGQLVFRNRRLDDVLAELGRYHDTRVRLQNPRLGELKVSGTFHTGKLDDLLNAITVILPVKIDYISPREVLFKSLANAN